MLSYVKRFDPAKSHPKIANPCIRIRPHIHCKALNIREISSPSLSSCKARRYHCSTSLTSLRTLALTDDTEGPRGGLPNPTPHPMWGGEGAASASVPSLPPPLPPCLRTPCPPVRREWRSGARAPAGGAELGGYLTFVRTVLEASPEILRSRIKMVCSISVFTACALPARLACVTVAHTNSFEAILLTP